MIPIAYVNRRSEKPPVTFILTTLQAVPPVRSQAPLLCFFSQKLHILFPSRKIISRPVVCCPDGLSDEQPHCLHIILSKNKK